jgi:peptidyl-prolyl cis-trans isomerase D
MLRMMRKNAKSWVVKFIFAVLIIVFSFWGVGSMTAKKMTVAATVNGKIIERRALDKTFRDVWQRYEKQARGRFNPNEQQIKQLKREALDNLINRRLLLDQAAALGLDVTPEELRRKIAELPAFQHNGRFNPELYRRALSYYRQTPGQFESGFKEDLLIEKVRLVIGDGAKVVPDEVDAIYKGQREEIALDLIKLDPRDYVAGVEVKEEGLKKFFTANREKFRIPEQRKIVTVVVETKPLLDSIKISPDEIAKYYQDNLDKYKVKERVKARHILIKLGKDASAEEVKKAKARIAAIEKELKAGKDFAELAKKNSEGPSAASGGDLGWFPRGAMVKAFEDAAFALKSGEVSGPVRTQFGFHLIKVEKHEPAHTRKLAEVSPEIEQHLRRQALPGLLEKKLKEIRQALADSTPKDFADKAKKLGYKVVSSGLFAQKGGAIAGIGKDPALAAKAFQTEVGKTGELVNPGRNSYFFMVTTKKASYLPKLDEVKKRVEKAYRYDLARKKVKKLAEQIAKELEKGKKFAEVAKAFKLKITETDFFPRGRGTIPGFGTDPALIHQVFALQADEISPALHSRDLVGFARLRERRLKDTEPEREKAKKMIRTQLRQYKRSHLMQEFVMGLRRAAEIKVMEGVLD